MLTIGLIVIYAISPGLHAQSGLGENYYVTKQAIAIGLGVGALVVMAKVPLTWWRKAQQPLIVAAALAAVAVRLFGEQVNGAYRWIQIGGLSFQAVELIKFALLIWLASFLADKIRLGVLKDNKETLKPILVALAVIGVVVLGLQSDFGSTGVMIAMVGVMVFVAGLPLKRLVWLGGLMVAVLVLAVSTTAYRRDRLLTFLHPARDCQNAGYQACQALNAVGSGGMFGRGLARNVYAHGYLPESANDSIFAIFAEIFGFVGVSVLLVLFVAFFSRLRIIAERAPDDFSRLLVAGSLAWLGTQAVINIGAMIGLLPLKGITLPFISYGGTSLVFVMGLVGLIFQISRYTTYQGTITSLAEGKRYGGRAYAFESRTRR
jgi:cell division protein FtsW